MRASAALPGLFTPVVRDGRLLVDGGLVNPVPVSLCRAMGADVVIAVDLNWSLMERHRQLLRPPVVDVPPPPDPGTLEGRFDLWMATLREGLNRRDNTARMPAMLDVLSMSLNTMQIRITNSRLAGEPADAVIRPRLPQIGVMDFDCAAVAIAEGRRAAAQAVACVKDLLA